MIQYLHNRVAALKARMDERGASAVEYGLLIAGIAAVIVLVVAFFGTEIANTFFDTCESIGGADAACGDDPTPPPPAE